MIRKKAEGRKRSDESRQRQSAVAAERYQQRAANGEIICQKCGNAVPPFELSAKRRRKRWPKYNYCESCFRDHERSRKLRLIFHLTLEEDKQILSFQKNSCGICKKPASTEKHQLAIDHRHSDGLIRGRLCWHCNQLIALAHDDPVRLQAAAEYLSKPPAVQALGRETFGLPGRIGTKKQRRLRLRWERINQEVKQKNFA